MALPHSHPLDVIDSGALGAGSTATASTSLLKTDRLQLLRLVLSADHPQPEHHVADECLIHCLEGEVQVVMPDASRRLRAGQLLVLPGGQRHSLTTPDGCVVLVALLLQQGDAGHGGGRGAVPLAKEAVTGPGGEVAAAAASRNASS